jgi:hypothetical protein
MHSRIGGLNSLILKPRQTRSVHRPHFFVFRQWLCILAFQLTAEILTAKEMLPSSPISLNDQRSPTLGAPLCCPCVFHYGHDFPSDSTNFRFFIIPQSIQTTSNLTNFRKVHALRGFYTYHDRPHSRNTGLFCVNYVPLRIDSPAEVM